MSFVPNDAFRPKRLKMKHQNFGSPPRYAYLCTIKKSARMNVQLNTTTSAVRRFLDESRNIRIFRESVFAGAFVFLLMGLISPFNVEMLGDRRLSYFLAVSLATTATGCIVGLFTTYILKMPLDAKLPVATVHRNSAVLFLINTPILAIVLTTINGAYNYDHACDIWFSNDGHFTLIPYTYFLYYIGTSTVFMYFGVYVRNKNWQLHETLREVRAINALLEKRQTLSDRAEEPQRQTTPHTTADSDKGTDTNPICRLYGNTNDSKLEVQAADIIYIESMANYASVCYLQDSAPTFKTLRITLKQVKESLNDIPYMVQCHRAFIVNLNFVVAITNRSNGYQLQIFGSDKSIPVSRTYTPLIKERLRKA